VCVPCPSSRRGVGRQPSHSRGRRRSGVACWRAHGLRLATPARRGRGRVTGGVRAGRVRGEASRRGIAGEALASRKATAGPWSWVARSALRREARGGPQTSAAQEGDLRRGARGAGLFGVVLGNRGDCRSRLGAFQQPARAGEREHLATEGAPGCGGTCPLTRARQKRPLAVRKVPPCAGWPGERQGASEVEAPSDAGGRTGRPRRSAGPESRRSFLLTRGERQEVGRSWRLASTGSPPAPRAPRGAAGGESSGSRGARVEDRLQKSVRDIFLSVANGAREGSGSSAG
jgi:hypothetical protein